MLAIRCDDQFTATCRHGQCTGSVCTQGSSRNSAGVAVSGWALGVCGDCRCTRTVSAGNLNLNHDGHAAPYRGQHADGAAADPAPPPQLFMPNASSEHPTLFFSPRDVKALRRKAAAHPKLADKLVQLAAFVKKWRRRGAVAPLNSTLFRSNWNTQYGDLLPPFAFYCENANIMLDPFSRCSTHPAARSVRCSLYLVPACIPML